MQNAPRGWGLGPPGAPRGLVVPGDPTGNAGSCLVNPVVGAGGAVSDSTVADAGDVRALPTRITLSLDDLIANSSKEGASSLRMPMDFASDDVEGLFLSSGHPLLSTDPSKWGDLHVSTLYALGHPDW